jgi:hypothetical protein
MNYTNDKLQQHFNVYVHEEQELYKRELGWEPVNYDKDLQHVIDSIEKVVSTKVGFFRSRELFCKCLVLFCFIGTQWTLSFDGQIVLCD